MSNEPKNETLAREHGPATAAVATDRLPELRKRLESLNKKATKLNSEPIKLIEGEPYEQTVDGGITEVVPVWVQGEAPRLNGWQFIATLEHDDNGTLIRRIPTFGPEVDLSQYRKATPDNCDHCGYRRRRNDTYIVGRPVSTGVDSVRYDTKQVGSNCLKDFIGGNESPEAIAKLMTAIRDYIEDVRGGMYQDGKIIPRFGLPQVLLVAASTMRRDDTYVSRRKAADTGEIATVERVRDTWHTYRRTPDAVRPLITPDDQFAAKTALAWVRNLTDEDLDDAKGDYLWNLYSVCSGDTIPESAFGYAASCVYAWQLRWNEQSDPGKEYLGSQGDEVDITFKVERVFEDEHPEYGTQFNHILKTTTGHRVSWRTGLGQLETGKSYHAKFTVKKQYESNYGAETQVFKPRTINESGRKGSLERYVENV